MAGDLAALIARMDAQRTHWAELPGGARVQFRRPLETEFGKFRQGVTVDHLVEYACGWEGFTEADLLGSAVGSSDAVAFSPELWGRVVRDKLDYVDPMAKAIVEAITQHLARRDAAAKN
jgi:hypothetical protein